jgi:hypothetical protein
LASNEWSSEAITSTYIVSVVLPTYSTNRTGVALLLQIIERRCASTCFDQAHNGTWVLELPDCLAQVHAFLLLASVVGAPAITSSIPVSLGFDAQQMPRRKLPFAPLPQAEIDHPVSKKPVKLSGPGPVVTSSEDLEAAGCVIDTRRLAWAHGLWLLSDAMQTGRGPLNLGL